MSVRALGLVSVAVALACVGCIPSGHVGGGDGGSEGDAGEGDAGEGDAGEPGVPPITLAPGFFPDPWIVSGVAGGETDLSSLQPDCVGFVTIAEHHVLEVTEGFSELRVVVNGGGEDVTLAVHRPDGSYLCNDDGEGLNPIVEGPFAAGAHRIFVGAYAAGERVPYRLGISELSSTTPESIGEP